MLIRNDLKQVLDFGNKLVKALEGLLTQTFLSLDFKKNLVIGYFSALRSNEGAYHVEIYLLNLERQRRVRQLLLLLLLLN